MRIEQLRETEEHRPSLASEHFDGVTRAEALRQLLLKHDVAQAQAEDEPVTDTRVARIAVNLILAASMLGLILRGMVIVHGQEGGHGQERTITISKGSITMRGPAPTAAEAAATLRANEVPHWTPTFTGPWLVVAPCFICDVQRLRDARDVMAGGRTSHRLDVDSRQRQDAFYGRYNRSVIGPTRAGERTTKR